jgi:hypothetical protein
MLHACGEGIIEVSTTHVEQRFNRPMAIGGAVILGISYSLIAVPFAFVDAIFHVSGDARLTYVPVVGAGWLATQQHGDAGLIAYCIANAVVQATGLAMLVASPLLPRNVDVPNEGVSWLVAPTAGPSSVGATVVVRGF